MFRQAPLAEEKQKAKQRADRERKYAPLPRLTGAAQKRCDCPGKQKHDETDSPDACNRRDLDNRKKIHLGVAEIAKGAVRRADLREIFVGHPGEGKSKRTQEE